MTYFYVDPKRIRDERQKYEYLAKELQSAFNEVTNTAGKLGKITGSYPQLKKTLDRCLENISDMKSQTDFFQSKLDTVSTNYEKIEKKLVDNSSDKSHTKKENQKQENQENKQQDGAEDNRSIAWKKGELSGNGEFLGFATAGMIAGELLGASYDIQKGGKASYTKNENGEFEFDELGINYSIEGEAHVAKGSCKGSIGYLSGNVNATVGEVSAKGGIGANLYKDGKLAPQVYVEAGAKAVAAKGDIEASFGSENTNAHVKAEGEAGTAEAQVSGQIGKITYTDKNGQKKDAYGVKAEAGAEAYVATGSVKGGLTIFGVDIDVGVSGKVGGAGGKVGGYATTGGVKGTISAGLGLGVGLDISIDWSDFHLGW